MKTMKKNLFLSVLVLISAISFAFSMIFMSKTGKTAKADSTIAKTNFAFSSSGNYILLATPLSDSMDLSLVYEVGYTFSGEDQPTVFKGETSKYYTSINNKSAKDLWGDAYNDDTPIIVWEINNDNAKTFVATAYYKIGERIDGSLYPTSPSETIVEGTERTLKVYTITFNTNGGSATASTRVAHGESATEPDNPTLSGWDFDGWYHNGSEYDFTETVTEDINLGANYSKTTAYDGYNGITNAYQVYTGISDTTPTANSTNLTIDVSGDATLPSEFTSVKMVGTNKEIDVTSFYDSGVLEVPASTLGSTLYGDNVKFLFKSDFKTYMVDSVTVVTHKFGTKADFQNIMYYGGIDTSTTAKNYDGYFVLTNNIEFSTSPMSWDGFMTANTVANNGDYGFKGIFDGQGFAINQIQVGTNTWRLFGNVTKGAVVKNFALTNLQYRITSSFIPAILAHNFNGTLENVSIDAYMSISENATGTEYAPLASRLFYAQFKDVVIKFDTTGYTGNKQLACFGNAIGTEDKTMKCDNVSVFVTNHTDKAMKYSLNNTDFDGSGVTVYEYDAVLTSEQMAAISDAMDDVTYWNMMGDQPLFGKSVVATKTLRYDGASYQGIANAYEVYTGISDTTPTENTGAFVVNLSGYDLPKTGVTSIKMVGANSELEVLSYYDNGAFTIPATTFASKIYGESVKFVFETAKTHYVVSSFTVVTHKIGSRADLQKIMYYGGIDTSTTAKNYDGYFVLTSNIEFELSGENSQIKWTGLMAASEAANGDYGFKGIFDGQGFKINMLQVAGIYSKMFGNVTNTAVVKNFALTNVKYTTELNYVPAVLAHNFNGTLENVFIDVNTNVDTANSDWYALLASRLFYAQFKDVVIKFNAASLTGDKNLSYFAAGTGKGEKTIQCDNVTVFITNYTDNPLVASINGTDFDGSGVTLYAYDEVLDHDQMTAISDKMADSTYWNMTGTQPAWHS